MHLLDPNRYFGDVVSGAVLGDGKTLALTWTPDSFTRTVEINVANVNQTPRILPLPLQLANEGETVSFVVRSVDADNDAVQLSLIHDQTTPAGVIFDATSGSFEWTPDQNTIDNALVNDQAYTFTFQATDGQATTTQTVQLRVFDVNRAPLLQASNHAVVIGNTLSIPVDLGGSFSTGILAVDPDGAAPTAALTVSFSNLPEGAIYDAQTRHLNWTPGAGQIGDSVVSAQVADGHTSRTATFLLRVVADNLSNAPRIVVSTTPSSPALPGQTVVATVRADAWSGIASITAEMRQGEGSPWQAVALDAAGRLKLLPTQPGLIELKVTATDRDGFTNAQTHIVRVKDPADSSAPQLAWQGLLAGADARSEPLTLNGLSDLTAHLSETQLMGWRLQLAPMGSTVWTTLAEAHFIESVATAQNTWAKTGLFLGQKWAKNKRAR